MENEDNEDREETGFDVEAAIAAREAAERGDYVTATDFFEALRAKIAARE
jgi:hypothetical protein